MVKPSKGLDITNPSNDQNLWMALGGDVKERAPSRGRSESP
jgi:hypothetical protein